MNNLETLVYNIDFDLACLSNTAEETVCCSMEVIKGIYHVCQTITILKNITVNVIKNHTGYSIEVNDIDPTHVMPNGMNNMRLVIIKFVRRSARNAVFIAKRAFKDSKYMITESLTKRRKTLLNKARLKFGNHNV